MTTVYPFAQCLLLLVGILCLYISKLCLRRDDDTESLFLICMFNSVSVFCVTLSLLCLHKWIGIQNGADWSIETFDNAHPHLTAFCMLSMFFINAIILFAYHRHHHMFSIRVYAVMQTFRVITILLPAFYVAQLT